MNAELKIEHTTTEQPNPNTNQRSSNLHNALLRQGFNIVQVNSTAINFGSACNDMLEREAA